MKKLLFLWMFTVSCFGAANDIVSAVVADNGWEITIGISGAIGTNGTFVTGFGTNNTPTGSEKVTLSLTSMGYDDSGVAVTVPRTIYGTKYVRFAYPDHAYANTTNDGTLFVKLALSDYVFDKDSNITMNALSGFYTSGANSNNAISSFSVDTTAVTNAYTKVVGNWSWPGYDLSGTTLTNRCVVFHSSGRYGRPVRAVKFTTTDGTDTVTDFVLQPTIDNTIGDGSPVVEYIDAASMSALAQSAALTRNFIAYPWIGDSGSVLDTSAGTADPTPLYGPIKGICDKGGTYGQGAALVNATTGDDATGVVYALASFNEGTAAAYKTIGKAAGAIAAFHNTTYSRNTVGGGVIYLAEGDHDFTDFSGSYGTANATWLMITKAPSATRAATKISNPSWAGDRAISSKLLVRDVAITTTTSLTFLDQPVLWLDQCNISATGTALITGTSVKYVTRNTVTSAVNGLTRPYANTAGPPAITRGNVFNGNTDPVFCYTTIGNWSANSIFTVVDALSGQVIPTSENTVFAFNQFYANNNTAFVVFRDQITSTHGLAFIQNVLENKTATGNPLVQIAASATGVSPDNNVLIWNNTFSGQRCNLGYNEGITQLVRQFWQLSGNLFYYFAVKGDIFALSAASIGNWSWVYQVACSDNIITDPASNFYPEFAGLNSIMLQWPGTGPDSLIKYVGYAGYDGTSAGAGNGNYKLLTYSPAIALRPDWKLRFDAQQNYRGLIDPSGAISSATPRKGGMFFAQ